MGRRKEKEMNQEAMIAKRIYELDCGHWYCLICRFSVVHTGLLEDFF